MRYLLFFLSTISIAFAKDCKAGGSIKASCSPNCLSSVDSAQAVVEGEPFTLNLFFYNNIGNSENCSKGIIYTTNLTLSQNAIIPKTTSSVKLGINIPGQSPGNFTFTITWVGKNFTFLIYISPLPPIITTTPTVIYNCNNFTINLTSPHNIVQVTIKSITPSITHNITPTIAASSSVIAGIFYTQTAGTYTFCFKVWVCNEFFCFDPSIYCYKLVVFPCSPHCLVCNGTSEVSKVCECITCSSLYYHVVNYRCCPKSCHCCNEFGNCLPCLQGYEFNPLSQTCCPVNCLDCYKGFCFACLPNFSPIYIDGLIHCISNFFCRWAELCDIGPRCNECQNGFYLTSDNNCCPINCEICGIYGECIECKPNYVYQNASCV